MPVHPIIHRIAIVCVLLITLTLSRAQNIAPAPYSSNEEMVNYIRSWDAVKPDTTRLNFGISTDISKARMTTQYFDGLGKPVQTVVKQGSLATGSPANDMVTATVYDELGRTPIQYLPFAGTQAGGVIAARDGSFKINPFQQDSAFSSVRYPGETWFYNQTNLENSTIGRPTETFGAGNSWVGTVGQALEANRRSVKTKYWFNKTADSVRLWTVSDVAGSFGDYNSSGYYPAGKLYKNIAVDEQGKQVAEFKNIQGLVVLKKVQLTAQPDTGLGKGHHGWLNTYYIYDSLGRLRGVVQPRGVELLLANSWNINALSGDILKEQCFRYEYDHRDRMIMKKVPGAGPVWMVYDIRDRMVMMQDSILRSREKWLFTKYDALNRPITTGFITDPGNYDDLGYHIVRADTSDAYPKVADYTNEELTNTFYDNYDWRSSYSNPLSNIIDNTTNGSGNSNLLTASDANWPYAQAISQSQQIRGMTTGTRTRVLNTSDFLFTASFYDDKARLVQVQSKNVVSGTDIATTQYSWHGQPLVTVQKQEKTSPNPQTILVVTKMEYDSLWRVSKIEKKVTHSHVNDGDEPGSWTTILENEYDALGQLSKKKLAPGYNSGAGLENLLYEYNIRGWILGMNRDYVKDAATHYFGFELGYDKTSAIVTGTSYANVQYNGNIGGTTWKSKGDAEKRKYDFTYDAVNRILSADFNQYTSGSYSKTAGIDFSLSNMAYDANGNILSMKHRGLKLASSVTIDSLAYNYIANSNKLLNVIDGLNDAQTTLGDFRTSTLHPASGSKTSSSTDYTYDGNGNMVKDLNKDIVSYAGANGITYNYLNLPDTITVRKAGSDKGTIVYTYDAAGTKLKKTTYEPGVDTTVTLYLGGSVYRNDTLEFISHEEGRVRLKTTDSTLQYDYFIKDHLGNVRMVLTEEQQTDMYPAATMETATATTEETFYSNLNTTRTDAPAGYGGGTPQKAAKLKAAGGSQKIGPAITLRVMAGDKFNLTVNSWWNSGSTPGTPVSPLTDLLSALTNSIGGITSTHGGATVSELQTGNILNSGATGFLGSQTYNSSRPKAFVNWVLFDEQFQFVAGSSGVEQVAGSNVYSTHTRTDLPIDKNGYLYIYVSNETPNIDVFFDNLQVTHIRGPVLEETHYYPFGLTMAGISSKALSFGEPKNKEQTFQGQRFDDDLGVNWMQFKWRNHDPQIGRFIEIDPLSEKYVYNSTYAFSENKVTTHVELEGLESVWAGTADLWRSAGITSNTDSKQFVKDVGKELAKPKTWVEGYAATGQIAGPVVLTTIMTGGLGDGAILSVETNALRTSASDASGGSTIARNAARGKEFEQVVGNSLAKEGRTSIAEQVTIKADNGVKTRIDFVSKDANGNIALTEAKSSSTAPLTGNQTTAFPSIAQNGGVVVGQGKPGYPGGTVIPPTKVDIIRPAVADATYVRPPIVSLLPGKKN